MSKTESHMRLADHLQGVLEGAYSLRTLLENGNPEEPLASCFHGLQHFMADADIRAKDQAYRSMQEGEMQKLIRLLLQGAERELLCKVTFLGVASV
jgi:hypothetical protein